MSMFGGNSPSLADIAAVTGNNKDGNNAFGGDGGIWALIILFALFGGWGNNGYGRNSGGSGSSGETTVVNIPPSYMCSGGGSYGMNMGFTDAAMQRGFDNQTVKLDGINSGICSLGYDQLAQMNGINTNVMQTGFGLQQSINNGFTGLSRQLSECCCDNRAAIKDLQYNMATMGNAINTNVHQTGDAIINSQTHGFNMLNQTIRDGFCNLEMREMQRENADLRQRLNNCDRDNALQGMSQYIVNTLQPIARPAYIVQNPNCSSPLPVSISDNCNCGRFCS